MQIRIEESQPDYAEKFRTTLDSVARERRCLTLTEAPPLENVTEFITKVQAGAGVQIVALNEQNDVVGIADIIINANEGYRHCGRFAVLVAREYRGKRIGRRLCEEIIRLAREKLTISRVELDVYASNEGAIALYESLGFVHEGKKVRARILDGIEDDVLFMALHIQDGLGARGIKE